MGRIILCNYNFRGGAIRCCLIIGLLTNLLIQLHSKDAKIDSLKQILATTNSDSIRYLLCKEIADTYYELNFDSLISYYNQALYLAKKTKNEREEIRTLRSFAYVYKYRKDDYDKAVHYFQASLKRAQEAQDSVAQIYVLNDLGELYRTKGERLTAIDFLFQANKQAEAIEHKHLLTRTWYSLGLLHSEQQKHQEALQFFEKALPLTKEPKYARMRGTILNSMGTTFQQLNQHERASQLFADAILLFQQLEDNDLQADVFYNVGKNETALTNYSKAISSYEKALGLNDIINNRNRATKILVALAEAYYEAELYQKAITAANQGLVQVKAIDTRLHVAELNKILAKSYEQVGQYKKALKHEQAFVAAKDSLQVAETSEKLTQMTLRYEQEKKNVEIEQLKAKNAQNELEISQTKANIRIVLISFIVLALLGILWQYYQKLAHLKQHKQLRIQLTQDLHDNVSSSLNHIKMMANRLGNPRYPAEQKQLDSQQIKTISDEVVNNMHDLIWSLDDSKESLEDLIYKMRDHASNVLGANEINYLIKNKVKGIQKILPAKTRNNIYAIYKESINNIVKHAKPEQVSIHFFMEQGAFNMQIKNDTTVLLKARHSSKIGMNSMKKRAKEMLGVLNIEQEKDYFLVDLKVNL